MKLTITKRFTFEAAHFLESYQGLCGSIHGHSYTLDVTVTGPLIEGDKGDTGMIVEFSNLKAVLAPLLGVLDHCIILEHDIRASVLLGEFPKEQVEVGLPANVFLTTQKDPAQRKVVIGKPPTTENIALWLFGEIEQRLLDGALSLRNEVKLVKIRLQETATGWAEVEA